MIVWFNECNYFTKQYENASMVSKVSGTSISHHSLGFIVVDLHKVQEFICLALIHFPLIGFF